MKRFLNPMFPSSLGRCRIVGAWWLLFALFGSVGTGFANPILLPEEALAVPLEGWSALDEAKRARLLGEVDCEGLLDEIRFLASDDLEGREAGTRGGRRAGDYLAERFAEFGLEPAGEDSTFFQRFEFEGGREYRLGEENNRLEFVLETGVISLEPGVDYVPFPSNRMALDLEKELVFVGHGIDDEGLEFDEYEGVEVRGKIVLVLAGKPADHPERRFSEVGQKTFSFRNKASDAKKHGASAILFCNRIEADRDPEKNSEPRAEEGLPRMRDFASIRGMPLPAVFVKRSFLDRVFEGRGTDFAGSQADLDRSPKPGSFEIPEVRVRLSTKVIRGSRVRAETRNVLGLLRGEDSELWDEYVVLGAHYDHVGLGSFGSISRSGGEIHNGADDNGSGTAALLEMAQALTQSSVRGRRSLLFVAFSAEERGLFGAKEFVAHPTIPLEKVVAMLNFDMIGRADGGRVTVMGLSSCPLFREALLGANEGLELDLRLRDGIGSGSDHIPFSKKGIPTLFFHTGLHPDYHRPSDDWEKITGEETTRVTRLGLLTALSLANHPTRPGFTGKKKGLLDRLKSLLRPGEKRGDEGGDKREH